MRAPADPRDQLGTPAALPVNVRWRIEATLRTLDFGVRGGGRDDFTDRTRLAVSGLDTGGAPYPVWSGAGILLGLLLALVLVAWASRRRVQLARVHWAAAAVLGAVALVVAVAYVDPQVSYGWLAPVILAAAAAILVWLGMRARSGHESPVVAAALALSAGPMLILAVALSAVYRPLDAVLVGASIGILASPTLVAFAIGARGREDTVALTSARERRILAVAAALIVALAAWSLMLALDGPYHVRVSGVIVSGGLAGLLLIATWRWLTGSEIGLRWTGALTVLLALWIFGQVVIRNIISGLDWGPLVAMLAIALGGPNLAIKGRAPGAPTQSKSQMPRPAVN